MKRSLVVMLVLFAGCSIRREPPSAIVRKAEACGAGDVRAASTAAAQEWFSRHRDCAVTIDAMCKPVRDKAPAQWFESTEGRLCRAARYVAQWVRKPSSDHSTFESGWK